MAFTNQAKPTTSFANSSRGAVGETWASITTTWASETRTWTQTGSFFSNVSRATSSLTNTVKP